MADIQIAGVMRADTFSPNHIGNDMAIFNLTAEALRKRGCRVQVYSEEEFRDSKIEEHVIMAMCREPESIAKLKLLEDEGRVVVNSGYGIENCSREKMTRILLGSGVPYPESIIVNTNENIQTDLQNADFRQVWIKSGHQTIHHEDVSYCRHHEEAQEVLHEYFYRGINRAVINRHVAGNLIKFYGVSGTDFFYWFDPMEIGYARSTEGETEEDRPYLAFDLDGLRSVCARVSEILDVKVFGGECIVAPDGSFTLIDFNDWPSFSPCRNEAAVVIAKAILSMVNN